jgi:GTP-dependent dephospho-CoA kinase
VRLPENLREQLKIPLGKLLLNKDAVKEKILLEIPANTYIITVGDATTEKMLDLDLIPSLQIVDEQEKRKKRHPPDSSRIKTTLSCDNPAGEITKESIEIIKLAYKSDPPVRITVNGEEDLLVIPVCIYAPENAVVMYGQPNEGLVIVKITKGIRNKVQVLLNSMN